MGKHRTTASRMFAEEMARACIGRITGQVVCTHMSMSMEMGDGNSRSVAVSVLLYRDTASYHIDGTVIRENGTWVEGTCTVTYGSDRDTYWKFTYSQRGEFPVATMAETTATNS